ncbi:hypothetical protein, partial [Photorhabdus bodei]|uniref:hypothetical protein n=1 Tax=Photorhabdus bodei TaxID=2029681 RepID=UPI0011BE7F47
VDKLGLNPDSVHLDITSFHVDGDYDSALGDDTKRIALVPGYSLSLSHISTSTDLASKYPSISVCSRNQPSHSLSHPTRPVRFES